MPSNSARVVFINRFFFPDESATAQILTDLARHLAAAQTKVSIVTACYSFSAPSDLPLRETIAGIEVRRVRSAQWGGRSLLGKLVQFATFYPAALIETLKILQPGDLVVAKTDPPLICVVASLAARLRRAHLINWVQDLYPEVATELRTPAIPAPVAKLLKRMRNGALKRARVNVVIGETMAARLRQEGVPQHSLRVVHNWADEQVLTPIGSRECALRQLWGFAQHDFIVGYSGNLGRAHEFETMLAAASLLSERNDIKFLFVGGGHQFERLQSEGRARKLSNLVFRPHQPREKLRETLAVADIHWLSLRPELEGLIVPSKFYGILAAGRPVLSVTATDGEIARLVEEHGCGETVAPGNCDALAKLIAELADDRTRGKEMGQRAREASEQHFAKTLALQSWSRIIGEIERESHIKLPIEAAAAAASR